LKLSDFSKSERFPEKVIVGANAAVIEVLRANAITVGAMDTAAIPTDAAVVLCGFQSLSKALRTNAWSQLEHRMTTISSQVKPK